MGLFLPIYLKQVLSLYPNGKVMDPDPVFLLLVKQKMEINGPFPVC